MSDIYVNNRFTYFILLYGMNGRTFSLCFPYFDIKGFNLPWWVRVSGKVNESGQYMGAMNK